MKHVLVTGGAGFIGSHLCEALLAKGYQVRVLDNLSYGRREWMPQGVEFIEGDICDLKTCERAMANIDGVFHCAAMSRSAPSLDSIDLCTRANILGTQNILMAAREAGVKKVIYSGSSTFYGNQATPHHEYNTPGNFLNFYALSKSVGENYCRMFDDVFDLPCVVLRYFSVYGPRQPQVGAYALVLGIFLHRWANDEVLQIHGDGSQARDFIHVRDIAAANIAAFESNLRGEVLNVGSGESLSIKELANLISSKQVHEERRLRDSDMTLADISRIQSLLGWSPQITFADGLKELMVSQCV